MRAGALVERCQPAELDLSLVLAVDVERHERHVVIAAEAKDGCVARKRPVPPFGPVGRREELLLVDASRDVVVERGLKLSLDHLEADGERSIATKASDERGLKQVISKIGVVLAEVDGLLVSQRAHEAARAQPVQRRSCPYRGVCGNRVDARGPQQVARYWIRDCG